MRTGSPCSSLRFCRPASNSAPRVLCIGLGGAAAAVVDRVRVTLGGGSRVSSSELDSLSNWVGSVSLTSSLTIEALEPEAEDAVPSVGLSIAEKVSVPVCEREVKTREAKVATGIVYSVGVMKLGPGRCGHESPLLRRGCSNKL
jgi:hypothetical protein